MCDSLKPSPVDCGPIQNAGLGGTPKPTTSPKSMTGHTTCAAGALNLLAALGAMRDGVVSPTINLDNPDPQLGLDFVANDSREAKVDVAMTNAFAFGGTNGAMVVCRPELRDAP